MICAGSINLIKTRIFPELIRPISNAVYLASNLIFLSVNARIYYYLNELAGKQRPIYNLLREFVEKFKSTNLKWLTDQEMFDVDHELPELKLNDDLVALKVENQSLEEYLSTISIKSGLVKDTEHLDYGEVISRRDLSPSSPEETKPVFHKKVNHHLQSIKQPNCLFIAFVLYLIYFKFLNYRLRQPRRSC
jgi:hypothetical protein